MGRLLLSAALLLLTASPAAAFTKQEVRVPMRDGVEMAVDLYLPDGAGPGATVPVILTITPYHALYKGLGDAQSLQQWRMLQQGYAVAMADVRGTYESGGCWDYGGQKEIEDGYDVVEWLGTQPWSNGRVGMIGASYDGTTANAAAVAQPPHLATIVPISSISRWYGYAYSQGARHAYSGESGDIDPPSDTPTDFQFGYGFLPPPEPGALTSAQQIAMRWNPCDRVEQTLHGYDPEPDFDDFWKARDYLRLAGRVRAPTLVGHGELDFNVKTWEGTQWFEALDVEKKLVIGQWAHAVPTWPEWQDFLDLWWARWLKGEPNGVESTPSVVSDPGDKEFRTRERWAGYGRLTAKLGGDDADYFDDGTLTESEMLRDLCQTRCVAVELPGTGGTRIMGRPVLRLRATSDKTSTHFAAALVENKGATRTVITRGFLNARYRDGLETGADLEPGKPYSYSLDLIDKDFLVDPDAVLELFVASSSTTWVLSDENRATNTLHLAESTLEIPVDGPQPAAPVVAVPVAPVLPPGSGPPARCSRRTARVKLKRAVRGRLKVTVNGRRARARRRGRIVTVRLPRTRTGRAVVRVKMRGRRVLVKRVRTCRR